MIPPLSIPSPSDSVWELGPIPIRGYALAIVLGIIVAVWVADRRWRTRGGRPGEMLDLALWAVPFGLVGGRVYHVITDHALYFGEGQNPWQAFAVWEGGLGVWGSIMGGAIGVIIGAKVYGMRLWPILDAIAPACLLAQGIGRWGNWFNQELFGEPTDLPWGLEIDPSHYPDGPAQFPEGTLFHPTFLYESLWCFAMFFVVVYLDKALRLGGGRVVALYVMTYTLGRGLIETLRIDNVQLDDVLGLRWSDWMSIILFTLAALWWIFATLSGRGRREDEVYLPGRGPEDDLEDDGDDSEAKSGERTDDDPESDPESDPDSAEEAGAETPARAEDSSNSAERPPEKGSRDL